MRCARPLLLVVVTLCAAPLALAQSIATIGPALAPTSGVVGGSPINLTITGDNFDSTHQVTVGSRLCTPRFLVHVGQIVCTLPEGEGADLAVELRDDAGTALARSPTPFSYLPPSLTAISPANTSTAGGTRITLTGDNFGLSPSVYIGGRRCDAVLRDPVTPHSAISCLVPEGQGTGLAVEVVVAGQRNTDGPSFNYDPPSISSISPASGPTTGGNPITLTGSSFGQTPRVVVGGASCTLTGAVTSSRVVCVAPAGQGASVPVSITVAGQQTSSAYGYQAPNIASISPANAPTSGGVRLTVVGSNFGTSPRVTVDGRLCEGIGASHGEIVCLLPEGEGTSRAVSVVAGDQVSPSFSGFSYDPPSVASVSPSSGPTAGGIPITLHGESFGLSPTVTVGGAPCPSLPGSSGHSSVVCTLPAGQGVNKEVIVTSSDGRSSASSAGARFSYAAPSLVGLSPATGPRAGGVTLTLTGDNFGQSQTVTVGGVVCPITTSSSASVACTLPAGRGQDLPVVMTVGGQQSNALLFSYEPLICQPGDFKQADDTCAPCPEGTFSPGPGATSCTPCAPGTYTDHSSSIVCVPCAPGSAQPLSSQRSCDACAAGTFAADEGAERCSLCPVGSFSSETGSRSCTLCPPGRVQSTEGSAACRTCVPGTAQALPGQAECVFCPTGTFADLEGSARCDACPPGRYQDTVGQAACLECPACPGCGGASCSITTGECPTGGSCPVCGDDVIESGEACDDGNADDGDGCSACSVDDGYTCSYDPATGSECVYTRGCGDGVKDDAEGCEDGNTYDGDGCSALCVSEEGWTCTIDAVGVVEACGELHGDGLVVGNERCDDGNAAAGDGCHEGLIEDAFACDASEPSRCTSLADCGNGVLDGAEACDDGDREDDDGCSSACSFEPGWSCPNDAGACDAVLGDGLVVGAERCDDGNSDAGDGCFQGAIEDGFACDGSEPSRCLPLVACGDGELSAGEECDDGNVDDGDGCDSSCRKESATDGGPDAGAGDGDGGNMPLCACVSARERAAWPAVALLLGLGALVARRRRVG